jgi:hypothetical protein
MTMAAQRKRRRLLACVLAVGAAWLLWNGGKNLLLLAVGESGAGVTEYSVASRGARNRTYEVHYVLVQEGREYRGSGPASRAVPAGARVPVRFLAFAPSVNAADSGGALVLWTVLWLVPGVGLAIFAGLQMKRG